MRRKLNDDQFMDALMQIVLILATYQKLFDFTHNDLHTNNIMYVETDTEFLYYKLEGVFYKVPTHGRIYKLIDFGRAIYKFNNKLFCSDSFAPSGDASTQYNCEPYFNEKKPRVDPNPSFDLCRLGCSLYDFVCRDNDPKTPLQKLVDHWCNDDYGKNMLYRHNGQTRYPDFKLYKMIARTVNNLVPKDELKTLVFATKYTFTPDANTVVMDIDSLPVYV
jgi:serine/threonine protein kinase